MSSIRVGQNSHLVKKKPLQGNVCGIMFGLQGVAFYVQKAFSLSRKKGTLWSWVRPKKGRRQMFPVGPLPGHLADTLDKLPLLYRRRNDADGLQIEATPDETTQHIYYRTARGGPDRSEPRRTAAGSIVLRHATGKGFLKASSAEFQLQVGYAL